ncbi:MAG: Mur ligase family protein [Actinomycetota bacterium]
MSYLQALADKRIAVVGAGVTGTAVINFLDDHEVSADLFDEKSSGALRVVEAQYDLAIVSPGWRKDHPIISDLRLSGCQLIGEIDFAWLVKEELSPDQKWVALTGTNGKTTTIQMLQSIFESSSKSGVACGNVGNPVIQILGSDDNYDFLAIELSSFQLEWNSLPHYEAVALLNIAPDHIDWHGSFDAYAAAKLKLLESSKIAIINGEDSESVLRSSSWSGKKVFYSLDTPQAGEIGLVENFLIDRAFISDPSQAIEFAELSDIRPTVPIMFPMQWPQLDLP